MRANADFMGGGDSELYNTYTALAETDGCRHGALTIDRVREYFTEFGLPDVGGDFEQMMKILDGTEYSGVVDFDAFRFVLSDTDPEVLRAFATLAGTTACEEGSECDEEAEVDLNAVREHFDAMQLSEEENKRIHQFLEIVDANQDGKMSFDEFALLSQRNKRDAMRLRSRRRSIQISKSPGTPTPQQTDGQSHRAPELVVEAAEQVEEVRSEDTQSEPPGTGLAAFVGLGLRHSIVHLEGRRRTDVTGIEGLKKRLSRIVAAHDGRPRGRTFTFRRVRSDMTTSSPVAPSPVESAGGSPVSTRTVAAAVPLPDTPASTPGLGLAAIIPPVPDWAPDSTPPHVRRPHPPSGPRGTPRPALPEPVPLPPAVPQRRWTPPSACPDEVYRLPKAQQRPAPRQPRQSIPGHQRLTTAALVARRVKVASTPSRPRRPKSPIGCPPAFPVVPIPGLRGGRKAVRKRPLRRRRHRSPRLRPFDNPFLLARTPTPARLVITPAPSTPHGERGALWLPRPPRDDCPYSL
eukprot:TRINITY_DN25255_c0_g1_i1.p1 TRINITY_DN25255_c0_g1~~TRINITY_DN25255_c0_g1_i1.p1  ORF type:complete len:520 (+),score=132.91 TRINITY_DN25255_c0_g1_i1:80-1639(+)